MSTFAHSLHMFFPPQCCQDIHPYFCWMLKEIQSHGYFLSFVNASSCFGIHTTCENPVYLKNSIRCCVEICGNFYESSEIVKYLLHMICSVLNDFISLQLSVAFFAPYLCPPEFSYTSLSQYRHSLTLITIILHRCWILGAFWCTNK